MPRLDVNRIAELEVFIRVVESSSFSAAARDLNVSPSAVSKLISRLEKRLGVKLLNRSTRNIKVTSEGCTFYEKGLNVLTDLEAAEDCVTKNSAPKGRISISCNLPFGQHILLPLIPEFTEHYPEIKLDLRLTDEVIDVIEQRADIAIRTGPLKSSGLIARKIGSTAMMIVGSPSYIEKHGEPSTPADLDKFNLLDFNFTRHTKGWPLAGSEETLYINPKSNLTASDGEALRTLTIAGAGLARLAYFQVKEDMKAKRLIPVLQDYNPGDIEDIHAVFVGQGGNMPSRIRVFLDFLITQIDAD